MHRNYNVLKIQDIVQYKQSKIIHALLTGDKKLPPVMKKLIVPSKNIHSYQTRHQNSIYEIKPRRFIGKRQLKCSPSKEWNSLPKEITETPTHGEFKREFYYFKLQSYKESTLNFAPDMLYKPLLQNFHYFTFYVLCYCARLFLFCLFPTANSSVVFIICI